MGGEAAHADTGTVLQPHDAGLIVRDGQPMLLVPRLGDDNEQVPEHILALTAMFVRWQRDPAWVDDLAQWFKDSARSS